MTNKEKAIAIIEAYYDDTKDVQIKDPKSGVPDWTSVNNPAIKWTFLSRFLNHLDCYKIIDGKS